MLHPFPEFVPRGVEMTRRARAGLDVGVERPTRLERGGSLSSGIWVFDGVLGLCCDTFWHVVTLAG